MRLLKGPIILLLIAACVYMTSIVKPITKITPIKKNWAKNRACIAESAKMMHDEAMRSYRLIDWENVTPEQLDDRGKLLSRLTVERLERDDECREKYAPF